MLTCLWGLFMAIQSARRLGDGPLPMTRRRVFVLVGRGAPGRAANKYRLYSILPHSANEFPSYLLLCLAAGIGEEVVYRGMLFAILAYLTGSQLAAVLLASVAFALAHAVQGP